MNRRTFNTQIAGLVCALGLPGLALAQPVAGKHFTKLPMAQPTSAPGKVEVLEFFSYACPHCHEFEPLLASWTAKLPPQIVFRRVPVPFLPYAETFQKAFYALEAMNLLEQVHPRIFHAVHKDKLRPSRPEDLSPLVQAAGGDAKRFLEVVNSFGVSSKVQQAKSMATAYNIQSVPSLAVQGEFLVSPASAGGNEAALGVVEYLVKSIVNRKG
jgi:thiol:disulfide interchange protein DsbA